MGPQANSDPDWAKVCSNSTKRFGNKRSKPQCLTGTPLKQKVLGIPLNLASAYKRLRCCCLYFFLLLQCGCFNQSCFLQKPPTPRSLPSPHQAATDGINQGHGAIPTAVVAPRGAGLDLRPLSTPRGPSQPCSAWLGEVFPAAPPTPPTPHPGTGAGKATCWWDQPETAATVKRRPRRRRHSPSSFFPKKPQILSARFSGVFSSSGRCLASSGLIILNIACPEARGTAGQKEQRRLQPWVGAQVPGPAGLSIRAPGWAPVSETFS